MTDPDKNIWNILSDIKESLASVDKRLTVIEELEKARVRPSEHCRDEMTKIATINQLKCDTVEKDLKNLADATRDKLDKKTFDEYLKSQTRKVSATFHWSTLIFTFIIMGSGFVVLLDRIDGIKDAIISNELTRHNNQMENKHE